MNQQQQEQDLLHRICNQEEEAVLSVLSSFTKSLKYYLKEQGCDRKSVREDLINETFVQLFQKKQTPVLQVELITYLMSIARNLHLHRKLRSKEIPTPNTRLDRLSSTDNIIEQMDIDESKKLLNGLISLLSPKCQELILLYLKELEAEEIRRIMQYASLSMLYKKRSQCLNRMRTLGNNCEKCCEFYNFD